MIVDYLSFYFVLVIIMALAVTLFVLKLRIASPKLVLGLVFFFIIIPLIAGYYYIVYFESLPEAIIPDVTGLPFEVAQARIEALDLEVRNAGSAFEAKYPEGYVISQRPESGRHVKIGRVVNLIVSGGKRKVVAPNLLGKPYTLADSILSPAELHVGEIRYEQNLNAAEGTIQAQEPLPGEEIDNGSGVDLIVSTTLEVKTEEGSEETE
ncbi:MAG: PASTA domain-containing protein [Candidatus Margulisbacteria bacterium]|nr:PASTA domain-containing protein [Candidatus Margulisiibacteriota bacterium]